MCAAVLYDDEQYLSMHNHSSPSRSRMQPNVAMVIKREQMLSRRSANQREVIRNKNHASDTGEKHSI